MFFSFSEPTFFNFYKNNGCVFINKMMHLRKMFLENQPVIKVLETKNSKGPHVRNYRVHIMKSL